MGNRILSNAEAKFFRQAMILARAVRQFTALDRLPKLADSNEMKSFLTAYRDMSCCATWENHVERGDIFAHFDDPPSHWAIRFPSPNVWTRICFCPFCGSPKPATPIGSGD